MRSLRLLFPFLLLLYALPARASDIIDMTVSGLNCSGNGSTPTAITLSGWSWGSTDTPPAGIASSGKIALSQFTVQKSFDTCSPDMLNLYLSETRLGTVTLSQTRNTAEHPVVAQVVLTNAWFASYSVGGSQTSPASETWTLSFDKVCVSLYTQNPNGTSKLGSTVCYP